MSSNPRVAVIVPSYNEEAFIGDTLAAIKRQTYDEFVCLIGDNGSSDGTRKRIAEAVSGDPRFVVNLHEQNLGAQANFAFLLDQAERECGAEFVFTFSSHDLVSDNYLERCVAGMVRRPEASMATGTMMAFSERIADAKPMQNSIYSFFEQTGLLAFLNSAQALANCTVVNSVWRLATYRKSRVLADLPFMRGPDHLIISWMASQGPILIDPLCTFYRRFIQRKSNLDGQLERISGKTDNNQDEAHRAMILWYLRLFDERFQDLEEVERENLKNMLFTILYRRFSYNIN